MKKEREQFFQNITIDDVAMVLLLLSGIIPKGNIVMQIIQAMIGIGYFAALIMSYFCGGGEPIL